MNSRLPFANRIDESPTARIAFAACAGLLLWLFVLFEVGRWAAAAPSTPVASAPLEMRMVELAPPPAQRPAPSSATTSRPSTAGTRVAREQTTRTTHSTPATQQLAIATPSTSPSVAANLKPDPDAPHPSPTPSDENPIPPQPVASTVNTAAHSIAQPLPVLPDDLREQAYQTVATARFMIHADGSADVELVKPTSSPRLNQILLEALHQWRFFPALQNGHPIESQQDIRVHFNVD